MDGCITSTMFKKNGQTQYGVYAGGGGGVQSILVFARNLFLIILFTRINFVINDTVHHRSAYIV